MSPVETEVIRRKLSVIIENLRALGPVKGMAPEEYLTDLYKRKATERLLQELIEAAIDINTHIIAETGHAVPDGYYETFMKMGELKVISPDLARGLAPSAGLRNRLVHEYDHIDHTIILGAVRMADDLYSKYVREINDYISTVLGDKPLKSR